MQGWNCGKGLIYLTPNISANKISLPQGQGYTEEKYYNCNYAKTRVLYAKRRAKRRMILCGNSIVVLNKLRPRVLILAHEGYSGIVCIKHRLRSNVWRPLTEISDKIGLVSVTKYF